MTEGGVTTTYTYDDWGRTISKADGTHSATYGWRFGDKLRTYASDFPGEADVNFQYDGLGKRRMKLTNPSAPTDADRTWYRWDAGWNVIGEYAAGTNTGTTWDVGALARWYQGKAAHTDGDPDSTAYNYYAHDHLGSPRTTYSQGQAVVARIEFTPYGSPMTTAGQDMDLGYTGHKWSAETGSFYAPYRNYNIFSLRWINRDPLGILAGPNAYLYVDSRPIRKIDKLGLQSLFPDPDDGSWCAVGFAMCLAGGGILGNCSACMWTCSDTGNWPTGPDCNPDPSDPLPPLRDPNRPPSDDDDDGDTISPYDGIPPWFPRVPPLFGPIISFDPCFIFPELCGPAPGRCEA